MRILKDIFTLLIGIVTLLLCIGFLFFPIFAVFYWNNPMYLLLFLVSWIPCALTAYIGGAILEEF